MRAATSADANFLTRMLAVAADWRPDVEARPVEEIMRDPVLAHYIEGWPRDLDGATSARARGDQIRSAGLSRLRPLSTRRPSIRSDRKYGGDHRLEAASAPRWYSHASGLTGAGANCALPKPVHMPTRPARADRNDIVVVVGEVRAMRRYVEQVTDIGGVPLL